MVMKMLKIYIDGQAGTTGLALEERLLELGNSAEIEILKIAEDLRKDVVERKRLLNLADVVFLCLPDEAAKESVMLVENPNTVIIDASTAHRTNPDWVYGFPELSSAQYEKLTTSHKIAVPGCHATGFIALVYPLMQAGVIKATDQLYCHSLTGYSGGGKQMIAEYEGHDDESADVKAIKSAAWMYAMDLDHKHLPEMTALTGLAKNPLFVPVVVPIHKGMIVHVPLAMDAKLLHEVLSGYYKESETIEVMEFGKVNSLNIENDIPADGLEIYVFGDEFQAVVTARFDNLGKGSSGAAVQCMKVRFGL